MWPTVDCFERYVESRGDESDSGGGNKGDGNKRRDGGACKRDKQSRVRQLAVLPLYLAARWSCA